MSLFEKFMFLLPPTCLLCGALSRQPQNICQPCQNSLPILSHHCPQCAQILPCHSCLKNPPPFDHTYALFPYEPPIVRLIIALKFQRELSHAQLLGELFILKIKEEWYQDQPLPDMIIPVPLHPKRLRERGFNQALEIARPISRALGIPLDLRGCERIRHTAAQSGLSASDRKRNVENAFQTTKSYHGKSIAVVDDVITTQHTMIAVCEILKQAGAATVDVWCAARAIVDIAGGKPNPDKIGNTLKEGNLMQDLSMFLMNHLALTYTLAAVLVLLMIVELLRLKRQNFRVNVPTAVQLINRENAVVIDIRSKDLFQKGHIVDAISLNPKEIQENGKKIEKFKAKPLILVCATGLESQKIAALMKKHGYNAYSLSGGLRTWLEAQLPLVKE